MPNEVKYVCSFGTLCHTARYLKNNGLKLCSYPFDWIFSNCNNIISCIEDDFKMFLDKSYYVTISNKKCAHSHYHYQMFNHHNPLIHQKDYEYFVRCVNRFRKLLQFEQHKLFIMTFPNMSNIDDNIKNEIINFNEKLLKYTSNYTLLIILHLPNNVNNEHSFTNINNICFLELKTISKSDGIHFINNTDNIYLHNIIKSHFVFNLEKL